MQQAEIYGNRIHKIYPPEEAAWYDHIPDFLVEIPDGVKEGWIRDPEAPLGWSDPSLLPPEEPELTEIQLILCVLLDIYEEIIGSRRSSNLAIPALYKIAIQQGFRELDEVPSHLQEAVQGLIPELKELKELKESAEVDLTKQTIDLAAKKLS